MVRIIQSVLLIAAVLFGYTAIADNDFAFWKTDFRRTAQAQGISSTTLDIALTGLQPDRKVLRLDAHQPEFTRAIWTYLENATTPERIAIGQQRLQEYDMLLTRIEAKYGVDRTYLVAIWGMESNYGQHMGGYAVVRSLATLAYAGRRDRRAFWTKQLIGALQIIQQGDMNLMELTGSWAGAIGHTQFIPTTFLEYAVDFDGDGRRDLKNSIPDALASTANYLSASGWQKGQPWGEEVNLPRGFDWNQADTKVTRPAQQWTNIYQVTATNGDLLAGGGSQEGTVYLPAGHRGPAFVLYPNFDVLLKYNRANSYALSVGHLHDRLLGGDNIQAAWPRNDKALSHNEKSELQELLSAVGYSTEGVDGLIGPNTRSALRSWQFAVGFPPDGYATLDHLLLLRGQAELKSEAGTGK